jgi:coniferyl-aldehyde dehydrogenase
MTALTEIVTTRAAIRHARRHLRRWMQRRSVTVRWVFRPGRAWIVNQPVGVVGIMGSWNFLLQLAISPLVRRTRRGESRDGQPSEVTAAVCRGPGLGISELFDVEEVAVVTGGAEVGPIFASLPFDHLLSQDQPPLAASSPSGGEEPYAGYARTGRKVAGADRCIRRSCNGLRQIDCDKLLNAGQICIAPDYALVPAL